MDQTAKARPAVFYIRHGETDWNVTGRLQGRRDVPLNARGRAQAMHCGEILQQLFARDGRNVAEVDDSGNAQCATHRQQHCQHAR